MNGRAVSGRHYGMDWLRIGAFGLLILYHIGMFFVPWDWHVKARATPDWVTLPMHFTNAWRLQLLFLVSGYASAAILAKDGRLGHFVCDRSARLLVPLVFGAAVIVPPQPWIELATQHGYAQGFVHFWLHDYFRFGTLDGIVLPTWQHLWFVVYLWLYTLLLAAILALPDRWLQAAGKALARVLSTPTGLVLLPLAWLIAKGALIWPGVGERHDVVSDLPSHTVYFLMLAIGFMLRRHQDIWPAVRRVWKGAALVGLFGYAGIVAGDLAWPGSTPVPPAWMPWFGAARAVQTWGTILALLGIADRFLNRDGAWRATLNEAVFPFYIVHQTLIVVIAWQCRAAGIGNLAAFAILVAGTATGCWLFYRFGREVLGLRILIGLKGWRTPHVDARHRNRVAPTPSLD